MLCSTIPYYVVLHSATSYSRVGLLHQVVEVCRASSKLSRTTTTSISLARYSAISAEESGWEGGDGIAEDFMSAFGGEGGRESSVRSSVQGSERWTLLSEPVGSDGGGAESRPSYSFSCSLNGGRAQGVESGAGGEAGGEVGGGEAGGKVVLLPETAAVAAQQQQDAAGAAVAIALPFSGSAGAGADTPRYGTRIAATTSRARSTPRHDDLDATAHLASDLSAPPGHPLPPLGVSVKSSAAMTPPEPSPTLPLPAATPPMSPQLLGLQMRYGRTTGSETEGGWCASLKGVCRLWATGGFM